MTTDTDSVPSTAELGDEYERDLRSCELQMQNFGGHLSFRGPIVTFLTPGDNLRLKDIVSQPGGGCVIVVDAGGDCSGAILGDNMATRAAANGWAGFVINGVVRDRAALSNIPIGIKALGTNPRRSLKDGAGERDAVVSFGDVDFRPGEHLVADDDGVVVLANIR